MLISDIAKLAGVGVGTVSRVINNQPEVSDKTREKVLKIIEETNYVPNNSARILKMSTTNNIGILVRGVYNPFFSEIIDCIRREVEKKKCFTILHQSDHYSRGDEVKDIVSFIKENKLKGLISLGAQLSEVDNETFKDLNVPIIFTSANKIEFEGINSFSTITIDDEEAAYNGVKYLISKGHKNIGIILGNEMDLGIGKMRFRGYLKALSEYKIDFNKENIIYGKYNYEDAYENTKQLLRRNRDLTAIFAVSDIMAIGASKAIIDNGLVIGRGISLLGFDGMEMVKYYSPSISTIRQPREEMAKLSVELLFNIIDKKSEHKHLILETELIKEDSIFQLNR